MFLPYWTLKLDAHSLLYSTILHYYASLYHQYPFFCNCSHGNDEQQQTNNNSGEERKQTKYGQPNNSGHQSRSFLSPQQEMEILDKIYHILCTPGTRTVLLIADKNGIYIYTIFYFCYCLNFLLF